VAGIQVGLTDKGLVLAGSSTPVSAAPIVNLLSAAHIGLSYLPKTETATSIRSAGLAIAYTTNVPSQGPVTLTMTYGQVSASAESTPQASAQAISPSAPVPPASSTALNPVATPTPTVGPTPTPASSGSSSAIPMSQTAPRLAAGQPRPRTVTHTTGRLVGLMPSGQTFYLLLVVSGVLTVAGSRLLGELAIRRRMSATAG
jgi:hypothetical protein